MVHIKKSWKRKSDELGQWLADLRGKKRRVSSEIWDIEKLEKWVYLDSHHRKWGWKSLDWQRHIKTAFLWKYYCLRLVARAEQETKFYVRESYLSRNERSGETQGRRKIQSGNMGPTCRCHVPSHHDFLRSFTQPASNCQPRKWRIGDVKTRKQ